MKATKALLLALLVALLEPLRAARILGVFPHTGHTHYLVFEPLLKELAARGHELVVLSHFPQRRPTPRWTDINLEGTQLSLTGTIDPGASDGTNPVLGGWFDFWFITQYGHGSCDSIYSHPPVRELIERDRRGFDLIINENFNTNCFLGLVHRFRPAPYLSMSSCAPFSWDFRRVGNPFQAAVMPDTFLWYTDEMSFVERLHNAAHTLLIRAYLTLVWDRDALRIARKHLGSDVPALAEIADNVTLILSNTHHSLNRAKPLVPGVVEIGGIHIGEVQPLPKDLERFVAGAKEGVVLFSLGTMIRTASLPRENAANLLRALGTLKQRVIWKWESDAPGEVPANVRLSKWLPQFDVLCHNNTRLLIAHGGLLSTSEAAHCGVPLLGIPAFGDQRTNLAAVAKTGAGRSIPFSTLKDADHFIALVQDMLEDPSFRDNAKALSARFRDRPMSPLQTAVYWTEYVIRHKGAPSLQTAARRLSWYQESLLDVYAVMVAALFAILLFLWSLVRTLLLRPVLRLACTLGASCDQKASSGKKKEKKS